MAAEHDDLLRRYRPQLVYDSLEAYFADDPRRGKLTTTIPVAPDRTYDVRLSMDIRTPAGDVLPSVVVRRTLDPGDHAPDRPFTTTLGTLLVPATEWLKRLFRHRP